MTFNELRKKRIDDKKDALITFDKGVEKHHGH